VLFAPHSFSSESRYDGAVIFRLDKLFDFLAVERCCQILNGGSILVVGSGNQIIGVRRMTILDNKRVFGRI